MEEVEAPRYWCHMCSQNVNPTLEIDSIKCPICQSGFVEEMASQENDSPPTDLQLGGSDSDRALSLWAPILLGMMGNQRRRRRMRRMGFEESDNENENDNDNDDEFGRHHHHGEEELDRELEIARRRRSSAAILQLLQGMQAGILSEPETDQGTNTAGDNEPMILINPFNQTIIVQGSGNESISRAPIGSLGDYFIGPGLDLLLQHLSENDPNRYGTPPARKEAVEALRTVKIEDTLQCSVCLDECEIGDEVKEMPCKHKFHSKCILPWLELHSSCPICRHQLPCEESELDSEGSINESSSGQTDNGDRNERGRQFSVPLPWPFSSLFSSSNTSNANPSTSHHRDEN
ncbi:E3 ubiquitin-protein ligase SIRP1-like [Salvia splendens]|uniref:E3 ubiquitin-protein ligase SIRP1-like n=1 Tax=Salvia splendens TaxID=180675 RepID=UPI001C270B33|nr:E3 ubiquitin-protein ligase SIRP1-like [Salvia splendens]XP_042014997.1 E3 ubiquitin-protein ligase SIRP1-like [Salvia splendens]